MEGFRTMIEIVFVGDTKKESRLKGMGLLEWTCDFELGNRAAPRKEPDFFGIEKVRLAVPNQSITFTCSIYDNDTGEATDKEITIDIKDVIVQDKIEDCKISELYISPVRLEFFNDEYTAIF